MTLTRRTFIHRLGLGAGAGLLVPFLDRVIPLANANDDQTRRVIFYVTSLGVRREHRPSPGPDGAGLTMNAYAALEPHAASVTVVDKLYHPFNLHLHGSRWWLSVVPGIGEHHGTMTPGGVTIDRHLAHTVGASDPIPSIALNPIRNTRSTSTGSYRATASADGPNMTYPSESNPVAAYARLFGTAMPEEGPSAADRLAQRQSVLDFVGADVSRVKGQLASTERAHLDQYLDSLRGLETKLSALAELSCDEVGGPDASLDDEFEQDPRPEVIAAHLELTAHALACGVTRIATLLFHGAVLEFLGGTGDVGGHNMWHGGEASDHDLFYGMHAQHMATLWEMLQSFPQGEGTMADSSLLVALNQAGGGHHNSSFDAFAMLLGDAGGAFEAGRYITLPESEVVSGDRRRVWDSDIVPKVGREAPDHCISDLYVSIARAMGDDIESFGDPAQCQGPLPQLGG